MTTKLRNIIYPKPISTDLYFFDDCNDGGKKDDKDKDKDNTTPKKNYIIGKYINGGLFIFS